MHALSAIVSGLLVTSGAAVSLLQADDLGLPLHLGNQAPADGGNETVGDNETESGNGTASGNETQPADNATADNATAAPQNATEGNQTTGNETAECNDEADCFVSLYDSGDFLLTGEGDWSWEITDEMRYVSVHLRVSSEGIGLGDSVDATLRDGSGRVIGELHRNGALGDDALLEVVLDRAEDDAYSGQWRLEMDVEALHGSYDLWVEGSCDELGPYWYW